MRATEWKFLTTALSALVLIFSNGIVEVVAQESDKDQTESVEAQSTTEPVTVETEDSSSVELTNIFLGLESPTATHLEPMQNHFAKLVEKVRPATVGIQVGQSQGSGVIVSRDGYVLTAAHVISAPDLNAVIILEDGTRLAAKTLGMNHTIDSGMLKIVDEGKWPYLEVGISETMKQGQWVMAIGHPGGFDSNRASPIRVGRLLSRNNTSVMQTDCTLVGGDSGGPLVDMNGNVVAIHSRIGGRLDQNFHVPIDVYANNWDDLEAKKVVGGRTRNTGNSALPVYMGVSFERNSLVVSRVGNDSPADKVGIKAGDEFVRFNDKRVLSQRSLRRELNKLKPNDKVKVVIKRDDEEIELEMEMGSPN